MARYIGTPLFGGAMIVDLPETFTDVSRIRQIPDHQEVFLDKDGYTSIMFDITERVGTAGTGAAIDGAAMTTHLEDIVDSETDTVKVWSTSNTQFTKLPEGTPAYTLIATQTPPLPTTTSSSNPATPDFTAIVLNLIRLEDESTDILITINVPHIKGEYTQEEVNLQMGIQGKLIENAVEIAARIWETFKIKDWGLFEDV